MLAVLVVPLSLTEIASPFGADVHSVVDAVLGDDLFRSYPASIDKHHRCDGGLLAHTSEVVRLANGIVASAAEHESAIDGEVVFLAALLHDLGKIDVYEWNGISWQKPLGYTKSLHIHKSIERAHRLLDGGFSHAFVEAVVHCIGSHHGPVAFGSLWEPKSKEAWAVHLADMTSVFCIAGRRHGA